MKILLDHNLDRRLKSLFPEDAAATAQEMGCADVVNGKLLTLAEDNGFEVLLTADANIKNQQNFAHRRIAILILRAFNNRLATHRQMARAVHEGLDRIEPGQIVEVIHPDLASKSRGID